MNEHIMQSFNRELEDLDELAVAIGKLAEQQLHRATRSLKEGDLETAEKVIEDDRKLNVIDVQADEKIIQIIVKRQPVAKDLRDILTVQKTITDLERVGDEARKIAHLTQSFFSSDKADSCRDLLQDIFRLSGIASKMLEKVILAFEQRDLGKALEVLEQNDTMEAEYCVALEHLPGFLQEDCSNAGDMVDIVLAMRALERIGGHAKNIAGYVIFLVLGADVRHDNLEQVRALLKSRAVTIS